MALREQLNEDMKAAMKARQADKLGALRLRLESVESAEARQPLQAATAAAIETAPPHADAATVARNRSSVAKPIFMPSPSVPSR